MFSTKALVEKIEELIRELARDEGIAGERKMKLVVSQAAEWLAAQTHLGPILDALEPKLYATVMWIPAQMVYDRLKADGKV